MEVGFAEDIPHPLRAEIHDVLTGIATMAPGNTADTMGCWAIPVERITILRRIDGGRSGADVLDVRLERSGRSTRHDRRVIKIDAMEAVATEWRAYRDHLATRRSTVITPIEAVSRAVLEEPRASRLASGRAAVVYHHVADYAGTPDRHTATLEDLARSAIRGETPVAQAVSLLDGLLERLAAAFQADASATTEVRSLLPHNRSLGPNLVLEVDRAEGPPQVLKYQDPLPAAIAAMKRYKLDVLTASTGLGTAESVASNIQLDDAVWLSEVSIKDGRDGVFAATWQDMDVEIRAADISADRLRLTDFGGRTVDVIGRVVGLRAHDQWERVRRFLPSLESSGDGVRLDGAETAHPFGMLRELLHEEASGRVTTLVHGDLNPRNILTIGEQVFLIDFAHTKRDQPYMTDYVWLETCLLRDVIAEELGWGSLLRLQRLLAVRSRLDEFLQGGAFPLKRLLGGDPRAEAAFEVLWTIRDRARRGYPGAGRRPWWRDYLTHLTLAACRTLKWPDDGQSRTSVRAVVAAAGVACEWLRPGNPYRYWHGGLLGGLVRAAIPRLRIGETTAEALAEIVGMLPAGPRNRPVWRTFEAARAAVTTTAYADAARQLLVDLRDDHEVYISLSAYINLEGRRYQPRSAVDDDERGEAIALLSDLPAAVLLGNAGSGKSTVAREFQYRLAKALLSRDENPATPPPVMPIVLRANDIAQAIQRSGVTRPLGAILREVTAIPVSVAMLTIGAVHLVVDAFNELSRDQRDAVAAWIGGMRQAFPHTAVLVCQRSFAYDPEQLPYPAITLEPVNSGQARRYIEDMLRLSELDHPADRAERLQRMLLDPEHEQVNDLARTPLFLWMIVKRYAEKDQLPTNIGALFADFAEWYLQEPHHDTPHERPPVRRLGYAEKKTLLEALAWYLLENGNITDISSAEVLAVIASLDLPLGDARAILDEIVDSGMLQGTETIRFLHQSFQEYFASLRFTRFAEDETFLHSRAMLFHWREPIRIMLGYSGDRPDLIEKVIDLAMRASPVFAAQMIRASENPPSVAVEMFIEAQENTLTSPTAGRVDWSDAAQALAKLGTDRAQDVLSRAVTADNHLEARGCALDALADMAVNTPAPPGAGRVYATLKTVIGDLLRDGAPPHLLAAAVQAAGKNELISMALTIRGLIAEDRPWPVVRAARHALDDLGIDLDMPGEETYLQACVRRLETVEHELRHGPDNTVENYARLTDERYELLRFLANAGCVDKILPRRFSYGVTAAPWSDWLSQPSTPAAERLPAELRQVLWGRVDNDEASRLFREGEGLIAVAAAHRLLKDRFGARTIVKLTAADSSPDQLLAAAAALRHLRGTSHFVVGNIQRIAHGLLDRSAGEMTEPLAALVNVLVQSPLDCVVLIALIQRRLEAQDAEARYRWPWLHMYRRMQATRAQLGELLQGDADAQFAALKQLIAWAMPLDAPRFTSTALSEEAKAGLARAGRSLPPEIPRAEFLQACVSAHCFDFLGEAIDTADPSLANRLELWATLDYGNLDVADLALVYMSAGYLAREAHEAGVMTDVDRAYQLLTGADTSGMHPSVERGRLVGLAVLGDWMPVLLGLRPDDPITHRIAQNAIRQWTPGPFSPAAYSDDAAIAGWIANHLSQQGNQLSHDVRATLTGIKAHLEQKLGRYFPVSEAS